VLGFLTGLYPVGFEGRIHYTSDYRKPRNPVGLHQVEQSPAERDSMRQALLLRQPVDTPPAEREKVAWALVVPQPVQTPPAEREKVAWALFVPQPVKTPPAER